VNVPIKVTHPMETPRNINNKQDTMNNLTYDFRPVRSWPLGISTEIHIMTMISLACIDYRHSLFLRVTSSPKPVTLKLREKKSALTPACNPRSHDIGPVLFKDQLQNSSLYPVLLAHLALQPCS
jgi:hypothetical protein